MAEEMTAINLTQRTREITLTCTSCSLCTDQTTYLASLNVTSRALEYRGASSHRQVWSKAYARPLAHTYS